MLFLGNNHISRIGQETFSDNTEIVRIQLESNRLRTLGNPNLGEFHYLTKLEMIILYGNYLKELNPALFKFSQNLRTLNLGFNELYDFDEQEILERFTNLDWFYYDGNWQSFHRVVQINKVIKEAGLEIINNLSETTEWLYPQLEYENITCLAAR